MSQIYEIVNHTDVRSTTYLRCKYNIFYYISKYTLVLHKYLIFEDILV